MANQAVYGIVANRANAETIIQNLIDAGISQEDISFLSSQGKEFHEFGKTTGKPDTNRNWRTEERVSDYPERGSNGRQKGGMGTEKHSKAPEGATAGGITGGVIGGALGLLAGIGALAIPGLGAFVAAGPLMAALAGTGAGGTIGGIIGALAGAGIPEYEAKRYQDRLNKGGILIAVRANNDKLAKQVKEIMQNDGAEDVSISSEATASKNFKK